MTIKQTQRTAPVAAPRRSQPATPSRATANHPAPAARPQERGRGASPVHLGALAGNFGERERQRPTPQSVHITQEADTRYNPGGNRDRMNGDCGPTSLVVGLDMLGLHIPGGGRHVPPQQRINNARLNMNRSQPEQDGLTTDGRFSEREHRQATSYRQMGRGAEAAGASHRFVRELSDVRSAVEAHSPVMALGNPQARGSYGKRANVDATDHIVAITGYDQASGRYTINDPLGHDGPLQITASELQAFMAEGPGRGNYMVLERAR